MLIQPVVAVFPPEKTLNFDQTLPSSFTLISIRFHHVSDGRITSPNLFGLCSSFRQSLHKKVSLIHFYEASFAAAPLPAQILISLGDFLIKDTETSFLKHS